MRGSGRLCLRAAAALALAASLLFTSCGGSSGFGDSPAAEEALASTELWDPQTGDPGARPMGHQTLDPGEFTSFVQAEPARAAHLQMAADMGYTSVVAAGRVTYDDGTVLTTAALTGDETGDVAMLVVGTVPGEGAAPEGSEAVFIAVPVFEEEKLVRVDFSGEKGAFSLDTSTGEVDLGRADYGSCAGWNCLAGAIAFWWSDDSIAKDPYMDLMGEVCMDCIVLPLTQEVTCPACAVLLAAPLVASVAFCAAWPCGLCVSDSCHAPDVVSQRCVTSNGASRVESSVTPWHCDLPGSQQSECVAGTTQTQTQACPYGCTPGSPTCQFPTQCLVGAPVACGTGNPTMTFCQGGDAVGIYQKYACVSDDPNSGGVWGECVALTGQFETRTTTCPYDCAGGTCQLGPTCDPAVCEEFNIPVGDPYCTVRPDDGKSVLVREITPHACQPVTPRITPPGNWPPAQSCEAMANTLQVVQTCPGECSPDGTTCATALVLRPGGVNDWAFGEAATGVRAGLTALLGTADETSSVGLGCFEDPADPSTCEQTVRWDGFTAFFSLLGDGVFEGYSLDDRGSPGEAAAATPEGIGIGSTVAELEAAYPQASWEEAFCSGIQGYVWPADFSGYRFTRSDTGLVDLIVAGFIPLFC